MLLYLHYSPPTQFRTHISMPLHQNPSANDISVPYIHATTDTLSMSERKREVNRFDGHVLEVETKKANYWNSENIFRMASSWAI